jgi:hypothetical protein
LVAHGHLDPFSSVGNESFWRNAMELIMWPLAPLWYLWPHPVTLLWVQDAATAATEALLFTWMCEVTAIAAERGRIRQWVSVLPAFGLVLLVASPWTIWQDSFDFHPESLDLLLAVFAAHAFWRGRSRRGWIAALLALTGGAIGATYVAGTGLSALLAGRKWRRIGVVLFAMGAVWLLIISHAGADRASGLVYANLVKGSHKGGASLLVVLAAVARHPTRAVSALWSVHRDVLADISSGGYLGVLSPWALGVTLLVLLEGSLTGLAQFSAPYIMNVLPAILLVPLGTITVCVALVSSQRRWRRVLAIVLAFAAAVNVVGWSVVWTPRTESQFARVNEATASTLKNALSMIPAQDEVIASQGIVGAFALRPWVYPMHYGPPVRYPVHRPSVWFVIVPNQGIETVSPVGAEMEMGEIAGFVHATLVLASNGVYVFHWTPSQQPRSVTLTAKTSVPAWTLNTSSGVSRAVVSGPAKDWRIAAIGGAGEIVSGDYWQVQRGTLTSRVRLRTNGQVKVVVMDDSTGRLIAERSITSTRGVVQTRSISAVLAHSYQPHVFEGSSVFSLQPTEPARGDVIEIQVWTKGNVPASIYSVGVTASPLH